MLRARQDLLVGMVFIGGVILIGIFTVVVKDLTLLSGQGRQLVVLFDRVSGLDKGHKVLASGMEVGQVNKLVLQKDGKVKAFLNLVRPIDIYGDYKISVKDASALGGKYVDIQIGTPATGEMPLQEVYHGMAQPSLLDDPDLREAFSSLKKIANTVQASLEDKEKQGTIALLITQRKLYDNILHASENLKAVSDQIRNTEGTIGKLLYERELADNIGKTVENIRKLTEDIDSIAQDVKVLTTKMRAGEGTVGKLLHDDSLYVETKNVMSNLSTITEKIKRGEGTIGKLVVEDRVYQELQSAIKDSRKMMQGITKTVDGINEGKGTLATLLNDEKLAGDLKDTIASLKIVSERLKKGEGTVGKLLADETLYRELQRVVKSFSDSLEDSREQVPISTFTGILFKAF